MDRPVVSSTTLTVGTPGTAMASETEVPSSSATEVIKLSRSSEAVTSM